MVFLWYPCLVYYQDNTGFIEWVWRCFLLLFCFLEDFLKDLILFKCNKIFLFLPESVSVIFRNLSVSSRLSKFLTYSCSQYSLSVLFISLSLLVLPLLSFLIIVIWMFSLIFFLVNLKGWSVLLIFSKNQLLGFFNYLDI